MLAKFQSRTQLILELEYVGSRLVNVETGVTKNWKKLEKFFYDQ